MKITSAKVMTVYDIDYTFEDFIEAAKDAFERAGRPNAFLVDGVDVLDMPEEQQLKIFRKQWHCMLHGDTYTVIARHLGFDGWKNAGLYDKRKDVRSMVVYNDGDDL